MWLVKLLWRQKEYFGIFSDNILDEWNEVPSNKFFSKKKVFFYTMMIVATWKEDIVRTFSYVSLIKKKRPQFNFSRHKVEKVCFHEKNNVFFTNVSPQNLLVTAHTSKLKMFRWQKLRQFSILLDFFLGHHTLWRPHVSSHDWWVLEVIFPNVDLGYFVWIFFLF